MSRDLALFKLSNKVKLSVKTRAQIWLIFQAVANFSQSSSFRIMALRLFGAEIGSNVKIRGRCRVHFPWNLSVGNNTWIGEEVWFINHEKVAIGSNVCISQRTVICSSGHDYQRANFGYEHRPIFIKDGAWLCLDAKVLPGVRIGTCSVVASGEVVRNSVPDYSMLIGGRLIKIEPPK